MIKASLIISTYNWPEALNLVLVSVLNQIILPNEIIIADDGSNQETKNLILKLQNNFPIPLLHIWHKDIGFRKTVILNKAIVKAKYNVIIQIDGDIVLHKYFIKDHLRNIKEGIFMHGSRVFLNEKLTMQMLKNKVFHVHLFKSGILNRFNVIHSSLLSNIFFRDSKNLKGTRGSNFSFFKKDFISVNGYNEDMTGWGKEDTELSARLINNGLLKRRLKFVGLTYHLYHKSVSRKGLYINNNILENVINKQLVWCKNGFDKYIKQEK